MVGVLRNLWSAGHERVGCGFLASREIEDWLEGRLSPRRGTAFEMHHAGGCRACAVVAADREVFLGVASHGLLHSERKHYDRTQAIVKAHLRQELASREAQARAELRFSWRHVAGLAAAAVLALVVAAPFLLQQEAAPGFIAVRGLTIEPMPFSKPPQIRGAEQPSALWARAEQAYATGDYSAAERLLAEIARQDPQDHDALMYRGVALIMSDRHDEAIPVLRQAQARAQQLGLSGLGDSFWLGVALLAQGETDLAREALARVRDGGGANAGRAAELLDTLE